MKKNLGIILSIALGLSALLLAIAFQAGWVQANPFKQAERSGAPTIVSYQGQIWDGEAPYDGSGYFKFAIVNTTGDTSYWSNDGSSSAGSEPDVSIPLAVSNGLFSINLGDTSGTYAGMTLALTSTVFSNPQTRLRVWFCPNNGGPFTALSDQVIAAVPYALQADKAASADHSTSADSATNSNHATSADSAINSTNATNATNAGNADTLDGSHASAFQLRVTGTCPVGYAVREVLADGNVTCELVEPLPTYSMSTLAGGGTDSAIVLGVDGLGLISFKGSGLQVAHCNNPACTSATVSTLDPLSDAGRYTDIAIGSDGLGVISYFFPTSNLKVAHCDNIACTSATLTTLENSTAVGQYTSIAIGRDGYPLISYQDGAGYDLEVAHCTNRECTSFSKTSIDTGDNAGQFTSTAIGKDGLGLIAYFDQTHNCLRTAHCIDTTCSSATITTHTGSGVVNATSLAIGSDGLGLIAYSSNTTEFSLKVAHCDNVLCSTATFSTHDVTGGFTDGQWPAVTIGADGLGLISHSGNGEIFFTHCDNLVCSTSSTSKISNEYGGRTAITTGMDGFGLITFQGDNYTSLRVVHCSNRYCIPYVRED